MVRAIKVTQESICDVVLRPREPLGVFLDACFEEEDGMTTCHLDLDPCLDGIKIFPDDLPEVGLVEPVIERAQSPRFRRLANMSTHGEMMDTMYSRRLLDAQNRRSFGISYRQANPLSE